MVVTVAQECLVLAIKRHPLVTLYHRSILMPDNAGDRKDVRRREKEARLIERAREDVVRNLMSTTQGREFVWNILAECQVFHVTFNGDALQSAFNEGRR